MILGLVTEQKPNTRKNWFKSLFAKITYEKLESPENEFTLVIVQIPFPQSKLKNMSTKKIEKLVEKAFRTLKNKTDKVILSEPLKNLCADKKICRVEAESPKGKELLLKLAPLCIRTTAKNCGISLINSVICIRDSKLDRISEYLLRELCFDANNIVLSTENQIKAEALCDSFYEETGLLVRLAGERKIRYDIVINVDQGRIEFGRDLFIRDANLGYNLNGFKANHLEIAQITNKKNFAKIKWKYSYE